MQRKGILIGLVLLASFAVAASGCKKKESKSKEDKGAEPARKARPSDSDKGKPGTRPGTAARKGPALAFPELKPVPPPKDLKDKLEPIEKKLAGKDWKARREARTELYKLISANKKHVGLARYLSMHKDQYFTELSFGLWKELKEHPTAEPTIRALMKHPSDRIRGKVLNFLWISAPKEMVKKLKPYLFHLLKDPSCIVKSEAFTVLFYNKSSLDVNLQKLAVDSVKDHCPTLQSAGAEKMPAAAKTDKTVTDRLLALAQKSPLYLVQCQALKALGRLKVKQAEKLMIKALTVEANTAMVLYYKKPRSPYTFNIRSASMPACGARALSLLHGKTPPKENLEEVRQWLTELSKAKRAPKPAKKLCIHYKYCKDKVEVCLHMQCVPYKRAVKAYWDYVKFNRCVKKPKDAPYTNWVEPARVLSGFGLHFMGDWKIKGFLQKKNKKAYDKKYSEVSKTPCPAK